MRNNKLFKFLAEYLKFQCSVNFSQIIIILHSNYVEELLANFLEFIKNISRLQNLKKVTNSKNELKGT